MGVKYELVLQPIDRPDEELTIGLINITSTDLWILLFTRNSWTTVGAS
ncbi:hypothetical protein ACP70R_013621 [Stipagrostis hirtigluma subsp. patula]